MISLSRPLVLVLLLGMAGCASAPAAKTTTAPEVVLQRESGAAPLGELVAQKPLTVLLFFSAGCPVQKAHDARLRELMAQYEPKGVAFAGVVSESGADVAAERADVQARGLALAVLEDRNAALADALGVEFSTHAVLLDAKRQVLYSGAVDSDRVHLTTTPERHLQNALDDALATRPVRKARTEALGCALRKH